MSSRCCTSSEMEAEIEAFIELHTIMGALKGSHRNTVSLWSERDSPPACRATMNRERFLLIKRFFRTDDRNRRDPNDPLCPVRYVRNIFSKKKQRILHSKTESNN